MLKYIGHICILLLLISEAQAQKIIEKSWDASKFETLEIVSDEIFKITITSRETESLRITTTIEGENYEQVVVSTSEEKQPRTLTISTGYTPYFKAPNDKLAAHKVISIEMELVVPKHYQVLVRSTMASVLVDGSFEKVRLELENGNCVLTNFEGSAQLNTINGNITVFAKQRITAKGNTMRGTVKNELEIGKKIGVWAQSVNGDITLLPSQ